MASFLRIAAIIGAAVAASGSVALEGKKVAKNESPTIQRTGQSQDDTAMQALCREILVDTDEGYGVTNHEARVVCDDLR
jgi:hypothetical protein